MTARLAHPQSLANLLGLALAAGLSIALAFTAPTVRAATTTVDANNSPYTVPGNQIASGDTVIVVDGGSLANGSLDLLSGSTLEFSTTATAQNPMVQGTQLTGVGTVIKSGAGTLRYGTQNPGFLGTTEAVEGTTYQLFSFSGTPTGSFSSLTALGGNCAGITWSGPTGGVWTSTAGTGGSYLTFTEGTGTLAVVPEPSTFALVAFAGVAGLASLRLRRRRKQSPSAA